MKQYLIPLILLSGLVTADRGSDLTQLLHNAEHANYAEQRHILWWGAAKLGDLSAQQKLRRSAFELKQTYWLERLVKIGDAQAALALSRFAKSPREEQRWLKLAAVRGVAQAQYELAMQVTASDEREKWLVAAAEQGVVSAQAALADWYLLQHNTQQARPWLELTAQSSPQSAFHLGYLLWHENNQSEAKALFEQAADMGHSTAESYLKLIVEYKPKSLHQAESTQFSTLSNACLQTIQPFATSLASLQQADKFVREFNQDERLVDLPICIAKPIWLAPNALNCSAHWQGQARLGCDARQLERLARKASYTHAVVFAQQGKANVNQGIMFLDVGDTYSVFVHELAHFAGFVDEYPLSVQFAERFCNEYVAPNLIVDGEITYQPLDTLNRWRALSPSKAIYPARTCQSIGRRAYKPSASRTFMENHDTANIPPLYLELWHEQLRKLHGIPMLAYYFLYNLDDNEENRDARDYWRMRALEAPRRTNVNGSDSTDQ